MSDDWIRKIRRDREAAEEEARLADRIRLENQRNYEAKGEQFWERMVCELERLVALFNEEGGLADKVEIEKGQHSCAATFTGVGSLRLNVDHQAQAVTVTDELTKGTDGGHITAEIVSSSSGHLAFKNKHTAEEFLQEHLERFFRRISGLG